MDDSGARAAPIDVVFGRYEVHSELGRGGAGVVYRGLDRVTGSPVAIKQVEALTRELTLRVHREILALRALPVPGVVRLIDEGPRGLEYFIVMELVDGAPFPGRATPAPWAEMRPLFLAFLETLARVHALGVVHRDLKPSNILVNGEGLPVFLDFGLARGRAVGDTITRTGDRLGTPRYWSPEQLRGLPVDARADIYAAGVLFFDVLCGQAPQSYRPDDWVTGFLGGPPHLRGQLPEVPDGVADAIARMLCPDPERRARSAAEVLAAFAGEGAGASGERLPRLSAEDAVATAARAIAKGRSVTIHGLAGSGRTRCLEDALRVSGVGSVVRLPAGDAPFASLADIIDDAGDSGSFDETEAKVVARLQQRLEGGTVLVADDVERVDKWTRGVLDRVESFGRVVRTTREPAPDEPRLGTGTCSRVWLGPIEVERLRELFHGPDLFLHLREDAAAELFQRTNGNPARVHAELGAWVRAGLCRWEEGRLRIGRAQLDSLRGGIDNAPMGIVASESSPKLSEEEDELVAWIHLAGQAATEELLFAVTGLPRWHIEAQLSELVDAGVLERHHEGFYEARAACCIHAWSAERRCAAHARLAEHTPMGSPRRIRHRVLAGDPGPLVEDTRAAIEAHGPTSHAADVAALLGPALTIVRQVGSPAQETQLLRALARVATQAYDPEMLHSARLELRRAAEARALHAERELVEAGIELLQGRIEPAGARLDALGVLDDEHDEAQRLAYLEQARGVPLDGSGSRAEAISTASALRRGMTAYRRGDFAGAVELLSGCDFDAEPSGVVACGDLADALLELADLDGAEAAARVAKAAARRVRHPRLEARATRIERTAQYRRCDALEPWVELVTAAEELGDPEIEAAITLTEAAIAWRRENLSAFGDLVRRAAAAAVRSGDGDADGSVLVRCLLAAGEWMQGRAPDSDLAERVRQLAAPRLQLQCAALLSIAGERGVLSAEATKQGWERAAFGDPRLRLEVLSPHELRRHLGGI